MSWQDAILTFGGLVLLAGLVQSIISPYKPPRGMSLLYALVLSSFGVAYYALGAVFAAGVTFAQGFGWLVLALQKRTRT